MRKILLCAALVVPVSDACAIERIRPAAMSCPALQRVIENQGAVILRFSPTSRAAPTVYDRYSSGDAGCGAEAYPAATTVPTRDDPDCAVMLCRTKRGHSNR